MKKVPIISGPGFVFEQDCKLIVMGTKMLKLKSKTRLFSVNFNRHLL